ncbi:hypothetical protein DYBT9623_04131 [Dyadobacter sp. CECT 9623]|uniref:Lipoprotein n=1 Tax=Dyadobacter linearis TaxID=2823330 RepID=A0ABN7RDR0_9BACT|nr:DUF6252 family protein [Dyadobacter sp. CECT 9623]CAG5072371.1 hypothetical protein DYBT9623_04131 [Dyadobacter sp. CECT 9623]
MRKLKLLLVAIALANAIGGCKPKQILPEPTQEGLNTFGVKIDGKVWLPVYPFRLLGGPKILDASIYDGILAIEARKKSDETIILLVTNVRSEGIYKFKEDNSGGIGASRYDGDLVDDEYHPYPGGINEINITRLDTVNKVVSGTFKVQLKGEKNNNIKNFTDGTFDLKL